MFCFSFQVFGDFPLMFMLFNSGLILLWLENISYIILIFLNVLRLMLCFQNIIYLGICSVYTWKECLSCCCWFGFSIVADQWCYSVLYPNWLLSSFLHNF
jgi:hypothetical protein